MRIAQVAPLYESVPPRGYGGTERVVAYLTDELVALGHEVTLFASSDSVTSARLLPMCPRALRLDSGCGDPVAPHVLMMERVFQRAEEFDVVHYHVDYLHFALGRRLPTPHVSTLHGRLDIPELAPLYAEFSELPLVSISDAQRRPLCRANWFATVYHGLPQSMHAALLEPGKHLAFVGRISPEKGLPSSIEVARRFGMPLIVAAKVDRADNDYYHEVIAPLARGGGVDLVGEVDERGKGELLRSAYALMFLIDWPEPFGLAMIEAMACGTPVIARRRGSVPEIVEEGVTGFIVETEAEAVRALERVASLDRGRIRESFDRRFSATRMARDYLGVYERLTRLRDSAVRLVV